MAVRGNLFVSGFSETRMAKPLSLAKRETSSNLAKWLPPAVHRGRVHFSRYRIKPVISTTLSAQFHEA